MLFAELPVVVAAGKRAQSQREAAASVSVVTADDIDLFGYRSLADVLRGQRSFYLHTDGLNWFAGVRGFLRPGEWNARLLVLVDGRPTREPLYGQTHLDPDFVVPIEAVKRVEVVRGPGSALYGGSAVFAVVNVVTKDAADVPGTGALRLEGGTKESARVAGLLAHTFNNGWEVVGAASAFTTEGDDDIRYDGVRDAARNFGHIRGFDDERAAAGFAKLRKGDFTIQFDAAEREKANRAATYLASWFDPGSMTEQRANLTLRYDHQVDDDRRLRAMTYVGYYDYEQSYRYDDDGNGNPYRYYTQGDSTWVGGEVDYDWQVTKAVHLTLGVEGTQALRTRQHDFSTTDGGLLDVRSSFSSWGVFGEGEWKVTDWLALTAGLRLDYVQRFGDRLSPRAAAVVTPTRADTFKLLYGRAFRSPNLYELYYASPGANAPNPNLRPEVVDTYEFAWEHEFADGWRTSGNYYYWTMSDALGDFTTPDGALQTRNVGNLYAQGVEFEVQRRWADGASLRAYGTYGRAVRGDEPVAHSPEWIVGTSVAVPVFNRTTFLAVEPQFVGPRESDAGDHADATFITNIVLTSRDVVRGVDLQAGVYNLFGNDARLPRNSEFDHSQPRLNYPEPLFRMSLTYRF